MTKINCPYCQNEKSFNQDWSGLKTKSETIGVPKQGGFWFNTPNDAQRFQPVEGLRHNDQFRILLYGNPYGEYFFINRFRHFKLELIGTGYEVEPPDPPTNPFFLHQEGASLSSTRSSWTMRENRPSNPYWILFNACRITHDKSTVTVDAHWWADHGNIISVHGFYPNEVSNKEFQIAKEAMEFFRVERRGGAKITERRIVAALQKLGLEASQRDVARALVVSERGLEKWRERRGIGTWKEVANQLGTVPYKTS